MVMDNRIHHRRDDSFTFYLTYRNNMGYLPDIPLDASKSPIYIMITYSLFSFNGYCGALGNTNTPLSHAEILGDAVGQLIQEELPDCYTVVITSGDDATFLRSLGKNLRQCKGFVHLDGSGLIANEATRTSMLEFMKSVDPRFTCRVLVLDFIATSHTTSILRFLEDAQFYLRPDTYTVLAGPHPNWKEFLGDDTFRNTLNILYFGVIETETTINEDSPMSDVTEAIAAEVFTRCLYCNDGHPDMYPIGIWLRKSSRHLDNTVFSDHLKNFNGHQFKIVCMAWFPYTDFQRTSSDGGTIVYPLDSLDVRMLKGIAKALNFTYEMRVPWDNQWGTSTPNGNWTGIVGTLQHHKGDFSMMLSWLANRLPVVDYSRVYASEPLVLLTLKSAALSQSFALIRPFTATLWAVTLISIIVAAIVLWALQRVWTMISGKESLSIGNSILLTWAIFLEDPPVRMPTNITAQMLIGWWWLYCMLVTITYRSSLIAHLTVPSKSPEINSLEELLVANSKDKWTWGFEPTYGSGWEWLKTNQNPTVKRIFQSTEVLDIDEQFKRLYTSRHAFITWKFYIRNIIASKHTDERGYTPIHTAKEDFFNFGGYGWGYRRGAPFRYRIDEMKLRLIESGAINFWMIDLIESAASKARIANKNNQENDETKDIVSPENESNTVLGMGHVQGVFFILIMGYIIAILTFLFEYFILASNRKVIQKNEDASIKIY